MRLEVGFYALHINNTLKDAGKATTFLKLFRLFSLLIYYIIIIIIL